jgi:hypothetical protein
MAGFARSTPAAPFAGVKPATPDQLPPPGLNKANAL